MDSQAPVDMVLAGFTGNRFHHEVYDAAARRQAPPGDDDVMTKLRQLSDLRGSGTRSDQEFAATKAKLLS